MSHPDDRLPDYLLGMLSPEEAAELQAHLEACRVCQEELRQLSGSLITMVEALPPAPPPADAFKKIQARLAGERTAKVPSASPRPARRFPYGWALAAVLSLVIAGGGILWGYRSQQSYRQAAEEQRVVAEWLLHLDVRPFLLQDREGNRVGSVLIRPDGQALFVLREPTAEGRAYQAWGHRDDEDELVSLGISQRPVFEVAWRGYEALYLSLEPSEGSPQPTVPLGRLRL
jgi:hypothetical protein